jgi:A/G-specific adenine glycosylase
MWRTDFFLESSKIDCLVCPEALCSDVIKPKFCDLASEKKAHFRDALVEWFQIDGRDYPWRRTRDAYAILVSEVMLQQTRLTVVLEKGYYERFMRAFPDVWALAEAGEEELLRVWEGLGYYRRARQLQAAARALIQEHGGVFPDNHADLLALPGVGKYTAGAVLSFAFDRAAALVDGNVLRVFSRLFDDATPVDSTLGIKTAWQRAESMLDSRRPRLYNSALMELGQRICKTGIPNCLNCPVASFCLTNSPEKLPCKKKITTITELEETVIFAVNDRQEILLSCETGSRRSGLWRLPARSFESLKTPILLAELTYCITRYRVRLRVFKAQNTGCLPGEVWMDREALENLPVGAPYRKVMRQVLT